MPWPLKRLCLNYFFKFDLDKNARIGLSWIYPSYLKMEKGAKIDHLNIAIHLDEIRMKSYSEIGRNNWITGFSTKTKTEHFKHQPNRISLLLIGHHSAITKNHHLDCTNKIIIGDFVTIAGYNSQLLTHSVNIEKSIQDSYPIEVGDYCFVGTNSTILGGSKLPSYSVLGAKSLLNKKFDKTYTLYGGVPAKDLKGLHTNYKYFKRTEGFIT